MPKKRKFISVDDKCRVCLCNEGCMSDIFSEDLRQKINDLGESTSISINDDESFPRNICHVCLYKLDMWIDFKKQFIRTNAMLREHLELGDLSDNKAPVTKRKHSELKANIEDKSMEQSSAKKLKSTAAMMSTGGSGNLRTLKQSMNEEQLDIKDSNKDVQSVEVKEESEVTSDVIPVASTASPKVKQIVGRRAKTTERRKESTKRWVARKKALLAATGENDTDTDSMVSEDDQLSPVQKARAKCNAEKVAESQRRMTRAMQNLDSNISGYYGTNADSESYVIQDSDSEARKDKTNCIVKTESPIEGDTRVSSNIAISPNSNNSNNENSKNSSSAINNCIPHSVRSELIVDGATFIVTSTLVVSEPHYLNPEQTNNSSLGTDEGNQDRNTDIIDAVQLRRVSPKNAQSKNDNKFVDTCLNIEVEGTELEALQRVQTELASFVEKEMKDKLAGGNTDTEKVEANAKDGFQTLDQQLKTIVEKTIKKNLENSKIIENRGNNTFTGEFLKAAMRSKIFQPRVIVDRYEPNRLYSLRPKSRKRKLDVQIVEKKLTIVPNVEKQLTLAQNVEKKLTKPLIKKNDELPMLLGKRRSIQPAKYADYNTSPFDSESEGVTTANEVVKTAPEIVKTTALIPKSSKFKTYGPATTKFEKTPIANPQKVQQSLLLPKKPIIIQKANLITKISTPTANNSTGEKHICGVCGDSFGTRKEVEIHFGTHKKQKMMRCKRCHEIVEAQKVKLHICSATRKIHKCNKCEANFRTEQLLARHVETHELERKEVIDKNIKEEAPSNIQEIIDSPKIVAPNEKNVTHTVADNRDSYTCFVCDKTFTDEELLKDHLQKHCDDISEDEQSNVKEYQCAICGESLDSEDALETHVEKHLFDDEDDNPNLISIGDVDKTVTAEMLHSCGQCSETFDSEMLLMLHMQAHEEEVAIAEWERRGIDNSQEEQHICVICDDLFATEDELSEHLDVHNGNAHICLLCDKPFLTLEELQSHVNTH